MNNKDNVISISDTNTFSTSNPFNNCVTGTYSTPITTWYSYTTPSSTSEITIEKVANGYILKYQSNTYVFQKESDMFAWFKKNVK